MKTVTVNSANPTLSGTGVLLTDVNASMDTVAGHAASLDASGAKMQVVVAGLPAKNDTDKMMDTMKAQIDGFKVDGAIAVLNNLSASVGYFPDPGTVARFASGVKGAKSIPPCLLVVAREIKHVNVSVVELPPSLGSMIGRVKEVNASMQSVLNGTSDFADGATSLNATLVSMGMGSGKSGSGIAGQKDLEQLQVVMANMSKELNFEDMKSQVATVGTTGADVTKVRTQAQDLGKKVNDPAVRPSKTTAGAMTDLDAELQKLPSQLADAKAAIEDWENMGLCQGAKVGHPCSKDSQCGTGGTCDGSIGPRYPAMCKDDATKSCTSDADCDAYGGGGVFGGGCFFPDVTKMGGDFEGAAAQMGPFDDGGSVVAMAAKLQEFLDDLDETTSQPEANAAVAAAEKSLAAFDPTVMKSKLDSADKDLGNIPDLKAMQSTWTDFSATIATFRSSLPALQGQIGSLNETITEVEAPLTAARQLVGLVGEIIDNKMDPLLTRMRGLRAATSLGGRARQLGYLIHDIMAMGANMAEAMGTPGASNASSSGSTSSGGKSTDTTDSSSSNSSNASMANSLLAIAPVFEKLEDKDGLRNTLGAMYYVMQMFTSTALPSDDTSGTIKDGTAIAGGAIGADGTASNRLFVAKNNSAYFGGRLCVTKACLQAEAHHYNRAPLSEASGGAIPVPLSREVLMALLFAIPAIPVLMLLCGCICRLRRCSMGSVFCMCIMVPWILLLAGVVLFPLVMTTSDVCLSLEPMVVQGVESLSPSICMQLGGTTAASSTTAKRRQLVTATSTATATATALAAAAAASSTCYLNLTKVSPSLPAKIIELDLPTLSRQVFGGGASACGVAGGEMGRVWTQVSDLGASYPTELVDNLLRDMQAGKVAGIRLRPKLEKIFQDAAIGLGASMRKGFGNDAGIGKAASCERISAAWGGIKSAACCGVVNSMYWYVLSWVVMALLFLTCGCFGGILGYKRLARHPGDWRDRREGRGGGLPTHGKGAKVRPIKLKTATRLISVMPKMTEPFPLARVVPSPEIMFDQGESGQGGLVESGGHVHVNPARVVHVHRVITAGHMV